MTEAQGTPSQVLDIFVRALNHYKRFIEFDFIFCSEKDFLYRQKGQLKLDNTILEEFFPRLVDPRIIPATQKHPRLSGPAKCFAGLSFNSYFTPLSEEGAYIKRKDQDFAIGRTLQLKLTENGDIFTTDLNVAYMVCELKTNLDKTMFQEACATAQEVKSAVSNSKYFLVCEWLDMPPIDTCLTSIGNVIVLRKCKRLNSNVRSSFSSNSGRKNNRGFFSNHLKENPLHLDCIQKLTANIEEIVGKSGLSEGSALEQGYF